MPSKPKSAREKLLSKTQREIVNVPPEAISKLGGRTMLIARPLDIEELVFTIPKGKLATMAVLRAKLARDFGAETTCPLTTGIFLRLVAEAAEEDRAAGKTRIAPYWRVIKNDGALNEKFPGGEKVHAKLLAGEGFRIETTGKRKARVTDFEKRIVKW
jgi:hypothetical protein